KTGHLNLDEPFDGLFTQGMVTHETYQDEAGNWVYPEEVDLSDGKATHAQTGAPITIGLIESMSKSKRNIVDPGPIIELYGADTARWFILSDTPPERDIQWTEAGVDAAARFVQRVWRFVLEGAEAVSEIDADRPLEFSPDAEKIRKISHRALAQVEAALENLRFNVAVAHVYEAVNQLSPAFTATRDTSNDAIVWARREALEILVALFAPMMPHLAEECWSRLGNEGLMAMAPWPVCEPELLVEDLVTIVVQVNGKRRGEIQVPRGMSREDVESRALKLNNVARAVADREIRKVIVVPERIVNVVA
ncbi:MAG: class I tRNA ligase family protein, partial [Alphaproteobacteria bacterium]